MRLRQTAIVLLLLIATAWIDTHPVAAQTEAESSRTVGPNSTWRGEIFWFDKYGERRKPCAITVTLSDYRFKEFFSCVTARWAISGVVSEDGVLEQGSMWFLVGGIDFEQFGVYPLSGSIWEIAGRNRRQSGVWNKQQWFVSVSLQQVR